MPMDCDILSHFNQNLQKQGPNLWAVNRVGRLAKREDWGEIKLDLTDENVKNHLNNLKVN